MYNNTHVNLDSKASLNSEKGLLDQGVEIRIGRFPVRTPLCAWPGLGTQSRYEAPDDLRNLGP